MGLTLARSGRTSLDQASSLDAITSGSSGLLQTMEHPENQITTNSASAPTSSVFPSSVDLNAPAAISAITFLQQSAQTALEIANQPVPIEAVSTADFVRHTSFKKNSKCIIRMQPSPTLGTSRDSSGVQQAMADQSLFFDKFSLQGSVEDDSERYQIFEGMEGETVFLFGRRPRVWSFPGIVLNGTQPNVPASLNAPGQEKLRQAFIDRLNMDFADDMIRRYEQFYRGTQALKAKLRCYISYENVVIECTLVGMTAARNVTVPGAVNINLTVVVHDRSWIGEGDSQDQTIAAIISQQDQQNFVQSGVPPAAIIAPPVSIDQLSARAADETAAVADAQGKVDDLQQQVDAAGKAADTAEANAQSAESDLADRVTKQAQIQESIDSGSTDFTQGDLEQARQDQNEAAQRIDDALSAKDEAKAILTARLDDLDVAQKDSDAAAATLAATQESLQKHPDGDGTNDGTIVMYTATLTTENGARIYRTVVDGKVVDEQDVTGTPLGENEDFSETGTENFFPPRST